MGIKQRREREKQEVRQSILLAAREIALQDGWQSVTIRKVAERIEYSPPTIYEYFTSKEEILLELSKEGFRQLTATLQAIRSSVADCEECLFSMGEAYWNFALQHPELYQVMHGLGGVPIECKLLSTGKGEFSKTVQSALTDWSLSVGVSVLDTEGAVTILGSFIHGLISLSMVNRIPDGETRAKNLLRRAIQDMLIAWRSGH